MHQPLIDYIQRHTNVPLTREEERSVERLFLPKKLRKKQYFLQEGDISKYVGFILKGAMRQYRVDDKGTEHIVHLFLENYWVTDRESSTLLTPSIYNIDAWEDTELLLVTRNEMEDLTTEIPAFQKMIQHMNERNAIANQRRLSSAISHSAEKRYEEFATNHPQFIQRFPQHIIASYLGITKETLSRIRKKSIK